MLTSDETEEIRTILKQIRKLLDEAWNLNNSGCGTDLSRKVTTYLPNIKQSYKYFADKGEKE